MSFFSVYSDLNFQIYKWNDLSLRKVAMICIILFLGLKLNAQSYAIDAYDGQTVNTCSGTFYDSGESAGFYSNNEDFTVTFCSDNTESIQLEFFSFYVYTGDTLYVYDGPDTSSPLLGKYSGLSSLPAFTLYSTGTCLTFNFISNSTSNRFGWAANISCNPCPPPNISSISPSTTEVCEGSTLKYYVTNHSGSTYDWTVINGIPTSVPSGENNIDITWDMVGGNSGYQLLWLRI